MTRIGNYRWLAAIATPPALVLAVLLSLKTLVSPVFAPNRFWVGVAFGCAAGFVEEIGWTGFAFPAMRARQTAFRAAWVLGLLWAVWHVPVIDFLGSATPHGPYWLPFFLAFTAAMTAMRVLICWIYSRTSSVLLAQLMHASSTGALAAFGPARVTAGQEALWYAVYALVLWAIVAGVCFSPVRPFRGAS
jgi:membrane protease YdiL (CAAX protease family)